MEESTYVVVSDTDTAKLMGKVSRFLSKGYQLQGGIAVASDGNLSRLSTYAQALVLPDCSGEQKA